MLSMTPAVIVCCACFFFSSRRRHTRFDCDWSSDVCSSDLKVVVRIASDEADTVSNRDMPDICMEHMVAVMLLDKTVTFLSVHDKARMKDPVVDRKSVV